MMSTMITTLTPCALAAVSIESICDGSPFTKTSHSAWWSGSRRSPSAKPVSMTVFMGFFRLAHSFLPTGLGAAGLGGGERCGRTPKPFAKARLNDRLHGFFQTGPQFLAHRLGSRWLGVWDKPQGGKLPGYRLHRAGMPVDMIDAGHRRHPLTVGLLLARKAAGQFLGTGLSLLTGRVAQGLCAHHHPLPIKAQHLNRLGLGVLLDLCRTGLGVKGVKVLGCPVDD